MRSAWNDWLFMGAVVLTIIVFFSFASQRNAIGRVVDGTISNSADCVDYSAVSPSATIALSSSLRLCSNTIHLIDYFQVEESDLVIDCQDSTIQGNGGALFVPAIDNPILTLKDCTIQGFDGLYSTLNPLVVRVETSGN